MSAPAGGPPPASPPSSPPPPPPPPPSSASPLAVLGNRGFALYWTGQAISLTGGWMQQLALGWAVVGLTSSPFDLGLVNFAGALPPALLLLHAGVAADRFDRRRMLLATQVAFMLAALAMAALVHGGRLGMGHVVGFSVFLGLVFAFDLPANQALVPDLVERAQIGPAVQLNQAVFHGSRLIGPALAGWLIARHGTASAFLANGLSFLPVIATLLYIRPVRRLERRAGQGTLHALREGLDHVRARPPLLALLGMTALTTLLVFPNMVVLMPYYVKQVLGLDAAALGTVMSASGAGAFVGAASLLAVAPKARRRRIGWGLAAMPPALAGLAAAPEGRGIALGSVRVDLLVAATSSFLLSLCVSSAIGLVATILQEAAPDHLRGRVMSLQGLMFLGTLPVASLLAGRAAEVAGQRLELLLAAALHGLGAALLFRWLPGRAGGGISRTDM